jgi:glycosyltransferase involved in cell wall biosynthesis
MHDLGACVIIPTYNNERTVGKVIEDVLTYSKNVIVVVDGATDDTKNIVDGFSEQVTLIGYQPNKGKGIALQAGFKEAVKQGFKYAITIDSDGQHYPADLPKFLDELEDWPGSMILGARNLEAENMPGKNSFANKFSNFWFWAETGQKMPDTQTGFRLYPLERLGDRKFLTSRFEFEIEVIVKLAWKGVSFRSIPIQVKYDLNNRVSHFRPGPDFTRISFLNAYLVTLALLWYHPVRFIQSNPFRLIRDEALKKNESHIKKAASIGFGIFFGIIPIWGFQLLIGIPTAIALKMNKVLFIAAANISIPPLIPLIIFGSYLLGAPFVGNDFEIPDWNSLTLDDIHQNVIQYYVGACVLAIFSGSIAFLTSLGFMKAFSKD